jgi:hypothetical protein
MYQEYSLKGTVIDDGSMPGMIVDAMLSGGRTCRRVSVFSWYLWIGC